MRDNYAQLNLSLLKRNLLLVMIMFSSTLPRIHADDATCSIFGRMANTRTTGPAGELGRKGKPKQLDYHTTAFVFAYWAHLTGGRNPRVLLRRERK